MTDLPAEGAGPEQRAAYLETEVTVEGRPAAGALTDLGPFWVVTAWNPFSEELSPLVNAGRHAELCQRFENDGLTWLPAVGSSPDGGWAEESVAVWGLESEAARLLGREFGQHAVFEVADGLLRVHACFDDWIDERPL